MIGRMLKMGAYAKSPKKAFGFFHPVKAAKLGVALWLWRRLFGTKGPPRVR